MVNLPKEFLDEMKSIVPDYDAFLYAYESGPTKAFRINGVKIDDQKLLSVIGDKNRTLQ